AKLIEIGRTSTCRTRREEGTSQFKQTGHCRTTLQRATGAQTRPEGIETTSPAWRALGTDINSDLPMGKPSGTWSSATWAKYGISVVVLPLPLPPTTACRLSIMCPTAENVVSVRSRREAAFDDLEV
ncbi:OCIA domain-containing protein 1, partial [Nibea albiflora]